MDPNATLRAFFDSLAEAENATDSTDEREEALSIATARAEDLFEWLANGGFAPDWQQGWQYGRRQS